MSIGQRIKELRNQSELTQKELAEKLSVSRGNVGDWESGKAKPGADALIALSNFFNVTSDWLLRGKDTRISVQPLNNDLSTNEIKLLAKFRKLDDEERLKVEGIIDGLLLAREIHNSPTHDNFKSTHSKSTDEHASTSETA